MSPPSLSSWLKPSCVNMSATRPEKHMPSLASWGIWEHLCKAATYIEICDFIEIQEPTGTSEEVRSVGIIMLFLNLEAVLLLESKSEGFLFANQLSVFVYSPWVFSCREKLQDFCLPSIGT